MNVQLMTPPDFNNCGPVAVATATQIPLGRVLSDGWSGSFRGNDDDSIIHHENALKRLGFGIKRLSKDQVCAGQFTSNKTLLMMISDTSSPLSYHWFVLGEITSRGVKAYDGRQKEPVQITWPRIITGWGILTCAYEITENPKELSWWKKAWVKLTAWIKFKIWG
jgi:hypothetical protein